MDEHKRVLSAAPLVWLVRSAPDGHQLLSLLLSVCLPYAHSKFAFGDKVREDIRKSFLGVKVLKEKNVLVNFYEGIRHKQKQVTTGAGVVFIISPNAIETSTVWNMGWSTLRL